MQQLYRTSDHCLMCCLHMHSSSPVHRLDAIQAWWCYCYCYWYMVQDLLTVTVTAPEVWCCECERASGQPSCACHAMCMILYLRWQPGC